MKALEALFPVFFMMFLGYLARKKNWITREQDEGAKKIVFQILFPFLVYNVLVSSRLNRNLLIQILFLDAAWIIIYFIGKKPHLLPAASSAEFHLFCFSHVKEEM